MIEFHAPTPADKAWVDELLAPGQTTGGCDYKLYQISTSGAGPITSASPGWTIFW